MRSPTPACSSRTSSSRRSTRRYAVSICRAGDRKSTRLNSSHANISYAVFCLKKKKHVERDVDHSGHEALHPELGTQVAIPDHPLERVVEVAGPDSLQDVWFEIGVDRVDPRGP